MDTNGKAISSYCTLSSSPPPPQPSDLPADLNQQQLPPLISPLSNIIKLAIEELDAIDSTIEEGDKASALSILEFLFQRQTEKIIAQISMSETSSFSSLIEPLLVESALAIGLGSTDAMIFILKSADQVFMSTTSGSSSLVTPPPPSDSSSSAFPTSSTNNNFVFANMPFSGHLKRPSGRGCWTVLGWAMKFRRFKIIELLCRGKSGTGSGSIGFSASLMVAYIFDCNTSTDQTNAGGRGRESLIIPNSLSPEQLAIALSYNEDEFNYISETCKSSSSASSATNMKLLAEKQRMLWDRESGSLLSTLILSQSLSTTTSTIHYSESFFLNIFNRANIVDRATFFTAKRNYGRSLLEYARSLLVPGATATTTTSASITSPTFATPLHQLLELRDNDIEADLLSDQPISNAYLAEYEDMEGFKLIGFTSLYNIDKLARLVKWVEDVLLMECRDQLHSTSTTTGSGSGTTSGSSSLILALLARLVSFNEEKLNQQRQLQDSDGVSSHQFYPLIDLPHTIHVGSVQTTLLTRMEVLSNEQVSLLARDLESRARRAVLEITGVCKVAGSTETKSPPPPPLPSWTTRTVFHRDDLETVVKTSHRLFIHFYRTYPRIFYAGLDGANDDAVDHHNENDGDNDSDYTSTKDFPDPTSFSLASIPQLRESAIERYISQNHHDSIKSAVETTIMEMATREAKAEMERARSNLQRQRTSSNTRTSTQGMRLPSFDKLKAGLLTTYNKLHFDSLYTKHRKFIRHELFKINTASAGVQKSLNDLFASGETMKLLSQLLQRRGEFISLAWGYNTNNGENGDVRLEDKTGWKNLEKQFIK